MFVPDADVVGTSARGGRRTARSSRSSAADPTVGCRPTWCVEQYLREHEPAGARHAFVELLGSAAARFWGLRNLSLSVAREIDRGEAPSVESALVKEMGTRFEQDVLENVRRSSTWSPFPTSSSLFERLLANAILTAPLFTIRGGTIEILRSVAAKGLRT